MTDKSISIGQNYAASESASSKDNLRDCEPPRKRARKREPQSKRESTSFEEDNSAITLVEEEREKSIEALPIDVRFIDLAKVHTTSKKCGPQLRIAKLERKRLNV
jgi:hypothetical protein